MIFLYIYIGIGLMTFVLYSLASVEIANKFKKEHKGLKYPEKTAAGTLFSFLKLLVACFVPIMHLALFWVVVFDYSDLEDRVMSRLYVDCMNLIRRRRDE